MAILDSSIVNVALPRMMSIFNVGTEDIQWVLTAYLLVSGVVVPVTGYLGDRFGYKRVYLITLVAFTLGSLLCAMAWSNSSLIIARILQALGGGMMVPISMAMLFRIVPRNRMGMAMGMWGIAATAAPAIGPTLGGYLVDAFSWRMVFTINLPVGLIAVFLSMLILEETDARSDLRFDIMGFILGSTACFCLLLALSKGQNWGWDSLVIVELLIASAFLSILFVTWELYFPQPMLDIRLLKNLVLTASLVATSVVTIGLFAGIFLIPIYAQNLMGLSPMETGLMMMPMAIMSGIMMPISGRLFDKIGAMPLGLVGLTIVAITTYQLHNISLESSFRWVQVVLTVRAVGLGMTMMPLTTAGLNTVPPALSGRASALNNLVRQVSASFGIAFLTYFMVSRQALHAAWMREGVSTLSLAAPQVMDKISYVVGGPKLAAALVNMNVQQQAMSKAISDDFIIATIIIIVSMPLMFFLSKGRVDRQRQYEMEKYTAEKSTS
ncbi:MAG: DHA2 family efflux MFS transporter permease subunit [Clostridiales bacterium]|nr:DHA2 family efflux MFS transporter permease subunit [Clostridiales bacterium]MCF8023360.1 DHA2 family efflux MFS transporter permease subunit [Clostridiales bacterium]